MVLMIGIEPQTAASNPILTLDFSAASKIGPFPFRLTATYWLLPGVCQRWEYPDAQSHGQNHSFRQWFQRRDQYHPMQQSHLCSGWLQLKSIPCLFPQNKLSGMENLSAKLLQGPIQRFSSELVFIFALISRFSFHLRNDLGYAATDSATSKDC